MGVSEVVKPGQGPCGEYGGKTQLRGLYEEEPGMLLRGHPCGVASALRSKEAEM